MAEFLTKGRESELIVRNELQRLKNNGVILHYMGHAKYSGADRSGKDFTIIICNHAKMRVEIPLQVKSSMFGIEKHNKVGAGKGVFIPAVDGQSPRLELDLMDIINQYKGPAPEKEATLINLNDKTAKMIQAKVDSQAANDDFGNKLKKYRTTHNLSQMRMAILADIAQTMISRAERGLGVSEIIKTKLEKAMAKNQLDNNPPTLVESGSGETQAAKGVTDLDKAIDATRAKLDPVVLAQLETLVRAKQIMEGVV